MVWAIHQHESATGIRVYPSDGKESACNAGDLGSIPGLVGYKSTGSQRVGDDEQLIHCHRV